MQGFFRSYQYRIQIQVLSFSISTSTTISGIHVFRAVETTKWINKSFLRDIHTSATVCLISEAIAGV